MTRPTSYKTLSAPSQAEFKDKGSRFIAHAYPIRSTEEAKRHAPYHCDFNPL